MLVVCRVGGGERAEAVLTSSYGLPDRVCDPPCRHPACPAAVGVGIRCGDAGPREAGCHRPCPGCSSCSPHEPTAAKDEKSG